MTNVVTSNSDGVENTISYNQMLHDVWEFTDESQQMVTDIRSVDNVSLIVDNPDEINPRLSFVMGGVLYTPLTAWIDTNKHWPDHTDVHYGEVVEVAIGLIAAGYGRAEADMPDDTGESVSESLQTSLMDAMFRSKAVYEMFSKMEQLLSGAIMAAIHEENHGL